MKVDSIIRKTLEKISLTIDETEILFREIMDGKLSDEVLKKVLLSLSNKGESIEEITGGAKILRERATKVSISGNLIDTCGTGGDGKNTVNISTASALVLASMGHKVAKHGNRSVSSKSGSADVLEILDIDINLNYKEIEDTINNKKFCFYVRSEFPFCNEKCCKCKKRIKKKNHI